MIIPYIIQSTTPAIVEGNFNPRLSVKSRYSTVTAMKNWRRKSRIEKIYKIEKPTIR
jgi:hypothetical protein